jgi:hypothetical protein
MAIKYIRRGTVASYLENQEVSITIGADGGTDTDTVENLPKLPDAALELEMDDGSVFVVLGYLRK